MRIACWVQNVTNTHSEHAILIAFPLQPRLHERAFMYAAYVVPDNDTKMHVTSPSVRLTIHVLWLSQLCQNNV